MTPRIRVTRARMDGRSRSAADPALRAATETVNDGRAWSIAPITSGCPTIQPIRIPARPKSLLKERTTSRFAGMSRARPCSMRDSPWNDTYVSLTRNSVSGDSATSAHRASASAAEPVGLLGLARTTMRGVLGESRLRTLSRGNRRSSP